MTSYCDGLAADDVEESFPARSSISNRRDFPRWRSSVVCSSRRFAESHAAYAALASSLLASAGGVNDSMTSPPFIEILRGAWS